MRTSRMAAAVMILTAAVSAACTVPTGSVRAPESGMAGSSETAVSAPSEKATPAPSRATSPDRTVDESGGFRLTTLSSAACTAEAPADWTMQAPDSSDRADLLSADGTMYAGYGIAPVNTALQAYAAAYDPPLNDPDLYSSDPAVVAKAYGRIVVGLLGGSSDLVADAIVDPIPDYRLVTVSSSSHRGAIFFHSTGFEGDGLTYSYVLPMYFAFATHDRWADQGPLVARVASTIRCRTQYQPPDDYPVVEAAPAGTTDANADEPGYDPQLGVEPVHDPTTGENYLVDPSVNWSETGPDGPGYYVQKGGNDYQRLEPGRLD